jgi:hydroxylamine reductase
LIAASKPSSTQNEPTPDVSIQDETTLDEGTLLEGLFATLTNVNFDDQSLERLAHSVGQPSYDLGQIWAAPPDVRSLKTLLLLGARGIAAYA